MDVRSARHCDRRRAAGRASTSAPTGERWRSRAERAASSCGTYRRRKELRELTDPAAATSDEPALSVVRYSPDGSVIASGAQQANHVTLWAAASGQVIGRPITTNPPGTGGAHSISFSPDSRRIAVPGAPGTVGIWEVATGRRVGEPLAIGSANVDAAIFAAAAGR